MVMGLMHIANSTAPNPKDPLVADYYTRQAVANNSTVDIERWNFLVGQMEKGTPFANFAPDAQQFLIDFQARIPQMQAEANAAQQQQNQFSASFSAETGLDFNNQGQIISPHGPSQAQLNLLRSFDQGQFEDVSTGGGFTTTPPATFGPNTPPALPAGGGQVLPLTLRNLLAQQGQRFIGPELEIAAQEAPLPGLSTANIPFGTPTGDIVERPDGTFGTTGRGTLETLLPALSGFLQDTIPLSTVGGGLGRGGGGFQTPVAQEGLVTPIPELESLQERIERELRGVPVVGGGLGLASELILPTTPLELALTPTGLGLAGDIGDAARLFRLAGNVGRASPAAFRNTIRFGGNLATGAPVGRNVPLPDLPDITSARLSLGDEAFSPTGARTALAGPGEGVFTPRPRGRFGGAGPNDFRRNVDEFGNPIDIVPGQSLDPGATNVSDFVSPNAGPRSFLPDEPLVTLPDGQIRRALDVDAATDQTYLTEAIERFRARNPVNRNMTGPEVAAAMKDARTIGGRPLLRNVSFEDIVRAVGGTDAELAFARDLDVEAVARQALGEAIGDDAQKAELVGRMWADDLTDITTEEADILARTLIDAQEAAVSKGRPVTGIPTPEGFTPQGRQVRLGLGDEVSIRPGPEGVGRGQGIAEPIGRQSRLGLGDDVIIQRGLPGVGRGEGIPEQALPPGQTTLFGEDAARLPGFDDRQWVLRRDGNWTLVGRDDPDFLPMGQSSPLRPVEDVPGGRVAPDPDALTLNQMRLNRGLQDLQLRSPRAEGPLPANLADDAVPIGQASLPGIEPGRPGLRPALDVPGGRTDPINRSAVERVMSEFENPGMRKLNDALERLTGRRLIPGRSLQEPISGSELAAQIFGLPRTILATADLSRIFRQDIALIRHDEWRKAVGAQMRVFFGPNAELAARQMDEAIRYGSWFQEAKKHGLYHAAIRDTKEEQFYSRLLQEGIEAIKRNVPGGKFLPDPVRASERAFITGGNKLRYDLFARYADEWAKAKNAGMLTEKQFQKRLHDVAGYLNAATGRGGTGFLPNELGGVLAVPFFAPRFLISRPEMLWRLADPRTSGAVRWIIAKDLASSYGMMAGLANAAAFSGLADVEFDPRSSDFMRLRVGDQRIDITGGWGTFYRQIAQLATGERKSASGAIRDADFVDSLLRFTLYKLSPSAGIGVSFVNEEDALGRQVQFDVDTLKRLAGESFVPLFVQDFLDALEHEGPAAAIGAGALGFTGIASQTYPPSYGERLNAAIEDLGLTDPTTGEPVTEWHRLDSGTKGSLRDNNTEVARIFAELNATEDGFTQFAEVEAAAAWERLKQHHDLRRYIREMRDISGARGDAFEDLGIPQAKNVGDFAQKVNDFWEMQRTTFDEDQNSLLFEGFEASLNPQELEAWERTTNSSWDENWQQVKFYEDYLQDNYYDVVQGQWQILREQNPELDAFPEYGDIFDAFNGLPSGHPVRSGAGRIMSDFTRQVYEANPTVNALRVLFGHEDELVPAAVPILEALTTEFGWEFPAQGIQ